MQKPFSVGVLCIALAACMGREQLPPPSEILGPYTATGTIAATGASLYRRGTHVLLMGNRPRFFLESKTIDLNRYEETLVVVRGELFPNTHPTFLPVLQVAAVLPLGQAQSPAVQRYDIPMFGLSLEAPSAWRSALSEDRFTFRLEEDSPFLTLAKSPSKELPQGLPLRIGGRNAVRILDEAKGKYRVYVESPVGDMLLFSFIGASPETAPLRDAFYSLLRSVRFEGESPGVPSGAPEGPIIPCGGPAHVLCPESMFCEVRERETGIGVCRML